MDKSLIQQQFGANAAFYLTSQSHAKGASLARLAELLPPQPDWLVLDVATAAGHTAFVFAPHVKQVWATDITPEMLAQARQQVDERGLENVTVEYADAESLPYTDATFDLVTCRIAPHHFGDVGAFLREASRVLKPGGYLAVVDNVVPDGIPGDYVNAFEKLRDPSHGRCLTMEEWRDHYVSQGLTLEHAEVSEKPMDFAAWAGRHDLTMQRYLRAMLSAATGEAATFFHPVFTEDNVTFHLREGILIGRHGAQ